MSDANSLIMGSSLPSCAFHEIGVAHEGTIAALDVMQARVFGKPDVLDFWKDGQPKMQAVITLKTDERDPEIDNDNGLRRLFVSSKNMRNAIAGAVKKCGASGLAVGGTLGVKYIRDDPDGKNKANLPKVYGAKYDPPPPGADTFEEPEEDYGEEVF